MSTEKCFNNYILVCLVKYLSDKSFFEKFKRYDNINKADFISLFDNDFQEQFHLDTLIKILIRVGFWHTTDQQNYVINADQQDWHDDRSFANWMVGGYGYLLSEIRNVSENNILDPLNMINGKYVALGSDQAYKSFMKNPFLDFIDSLEFESVVDLGCGNAGRLIDVCSRFPHSKGMGVDINSKAVELARKNVKSYNLQESIDIVCSDAIASPINGRTNHKSPNIVMSFMMMHDLLSAYGSEHVTTALVKNFARPKYFLIADTHSTSNNLDGVDNKIFTNAFELIHWSRGIRIFDEETYLSLFKHEGYRLEATWSLSVPNTKMFAYERIK